MRIDIGCAADLCEETGFAEVICNAFDEPALGLFLPDGWGFSVSATLETRSATCTVAGWTSVSFYCPKHNPANEKPDQPQVSTEDEGEDMVLCSECESLWPPTGLEWDEACRTERCPGCAEADDLRRVTLTGTRCSVCGLPQFNCPHGIVCPKGHGGAEPMKEEP